MPIFDGENLIITLDLGVTEVDIEKDLYSQWKEWQLDTTNGQNNRGYPPAFRTIGGDELTLAIDAGAYFFIRNDLGWRVRPPEEDTTIYLTGNLTPQDALLPILIPTIDNYRVLVDGLQPITQSVDKILLQQQQAFYNGKVYIDFPRGEVGQAFPVGLASTPANNSNDAHSIADLYGLYEFVIKDGTFVAPHNFLSYKFIGHGKFSFINLSNYDFSGSVFERMSFINTDFTNTPQAITIIQGSIISGATNISGDIDYTGLNGIIKLQSSSTTTITNCHSYEPGVDTPILDAQNGDNVLLQMRNYNGGVKLINYSSTGNIASFDLNSSHLILDSTITEGIIVVRGIGHITNNILESSTGVTLVTKGFVEGNYITEIYKHTGLDINDPTILTENSETDVDMDNEDIKVKITKAANVRTIQRQVTP